ncbi:Eco57I restriction-modification methylase domain-containing protein [Flavobacterium sp.]|uniref:Eco57I restriction-modification methylase domain-containing protein n=1 Tax=Flavobacterium sp. TaxID=239 RepID=UPI003752C31E
MAQANTINTAILNEIIIGRVEPQIYAFTTQTIPNYLKVGDTYRPIETRLNEWRKYFPNLEKKYGNVAKVDDETFFRDYAVHYYLENDLNRKRLGRDVFKDIYYSNEFFENATQKDLQDAIDDIQKGHQNNESKYQYYRFDESHIPITHTYTRTEEYPLRPNQQKTVANFREAINKGRTNLLMYAVMRFGKSFTAMSCAVEMEAKLVVVVSAKADVRGEWKKTVESLKNFEGYCFLESDDLLRDELIIAEKQKANEKIVLFLTLQDLQGDTIKSKHASVFKNEIDLLLIDETHFGARATEYGKVLNEKKSEQEKLSATQQKNENKLNDNSIDDIQIIEKELKAKIRIHLSGTPYRILMNSEFTDDDIIAFYQFTDIADDQEQWNARVRIINDHRETLGKEEIDEWKNPYYGFPQMIRFAFNPNESSLKKMEELKKNGITYAFSELFKPQSITKDNTTHLHKKFLHEQEILDLLKVIDGSEEDANLLSFLDYDKIKEGKMCRHIVCVLPYRASCDALEELIKMQDFKHLSNYEIINISGVENEKNFKDTQAVQDKIKKWESENVKTITLTVNRMLTGSTVPEWDTMLYLKDTASPQEYDQAIFRLQNQYIKTYVDDKKDVIKYNMKPQTLLVDFNPTRMFVMQEEKAQIYNINTDTDGNLKLVERLKRELEVSPIIHLNKDKLVQVNPTDILNAVREYSSNRSVLDEAKVIPLDLSLLLIDEIRREIERQNEIGSNNGLKIEPHKKTDEGDELDIPAGTNKPDGGNKPTNGTEKPEEKDTYEASIRKKFASYYSRILFFAFCTEEKLMSLQEIIDLIETDEESKRIADNLELNIEILKLLRSNIQHYVLSKLEYKIQNINHLANDASVEPVERASRAMKKFTRLSESEIVTPEIITDKMISGLPENAIDSHTMLLDIASKQGEFVYAVYKKFGKDIAINFYSIPTSKTAYEFTRKVYKLLDLDVTQIETTYTSYDLISENNFIENETIKINNKTMKFDIIVGNPPYQQSGEARDEPIYQHFYDLAENLSDQYILISPARFLFNAGQTPKIWNEKMLSDKHLKVEFYEQDSSKLFQNTDIKGGLTILYRNKNQHLEPIGTFTHFKELTTIAKKVVQNTEFSLSALVQPQGIYRFSDAFFRKYPLAEKMQGKGTKNKIVSKSFSEMDFAFSDNRESQDFVKMIGLVKSKRQYKWIDIKYLSLPDSFEKWKVVLPEANGSGLIGEVLSTPFIGQPFIGHTDTFLSIGAFDNELEAQNVLKYVKSKFVRTMLGILKITQHNSRATWRKVPLQDFTTNSNIDWTKSISEIDKQLYKKYDLSPEEIDFITKMIKPMD